MKYFDILSKTAFLSVMAAQVLASSDKTFIPQAYADLDPSAFHQIEISTTKSTQQSFQLAGETIHITQPKTTKNKGTSNNYSFTQNLPNGFISATQGENSLFGQIHLHNKHYILTTNQAGIWAVELPSSGLSYNDCGMDHHDTMPTQNKLPTNKTIKAAGTLIDVLMIYDQAIADRYPGDLLQTRVDQYFHVANQTYANSAIDLAIRQVGLAQVGYDLDNRNQVLRDQLQQTLFFNIGVLGLEAVPQLYANSGADMVIFLRTMDIETRGNCGIAYFPRQTNGNYDASYGVNVMADGMSSWSICTDQLMVHEIGHNLGAGHHNWNPPDFGYPAEAKGFSKLGQFATVMGSFGTGQPDRFFELDYFSNPNVQCGGGPCGIPGQNNNASLLNQFKGIVASYQNSVSNAPIPADFELALTDIDGDGVLDQDDEFPFDGSESSDLDGDGVGDNADAFPSNAGETSDFDQDGTGDNADNDTDDDGVSNFNDAFPFDASETNDADQDGVGDNTDALPFERTEFKDSDEDGIGNNMDSDDDDDGVIDIATDKQDILVISVGNNRILRYDGQSGLAKGIEVLPSDGLLTFQSDLAYDNRSHQLYFSSASSIKSLDLMNPYALPEIRIHPYPTTDSKAVLNTGFPTALATDSDANLYLAKLRGTSIEKFGVLNQQVDEFSTTFLSLNSEAENIIDIERLDNQYFLQGQTNSVYKAVNQFEVNPLGVGNYSWLSNPYAMVATTNNQLLHSDPGLNRIVVTNSDNGTFGGVFADLTSLGYSNPLGMDVTDDGRLLVVASDQNAILQFDLNTQEFLGELVSGEGMDQPHRILMVPQLADRFNQDEDKVIRPNAGNWFNPATNGRGFNIGIFNNRLQVLWFTYDNDGSPIWYTSSDFLIGHEYETGLLKTQLNADDTVSVTNIGNIQITFENERTAHMRWQIGDDSGEEPIYWLQFSGEPESVNHTGMWSRADTPGWGTAVITNGDVSIMIPFIYDDTGEPRWAISNVADATSPFDLTLGAVFSDTLCPACSGEPITDILPAGNMQFNLLDAPYWSSDLTWPAPLSGNWQLQQTDLIRISSEPTKPR